MSLEDRCSRCRDVVMYCECPYTDPAWFGPRDAIHCAHCSARPGHCDCPVDEFTTTSSKYLSEDEGFTRSGPGGYEANTAYPHSFYGSWSGGEERDR